MKPCIFEINFSNVGSTGGIMLQIADTAQKQGYNVTNCCPDSRTNRLKKRSDTWLMGNRISRNIHVCFRKIFGLTGLFSFCATLKLIRKMKLQKCSLVHLHNIHGDFLNLPLLFRYIKSNNIPVIWTLHDCWAFTGRCPYFELTKCQKWKTGCNKCPYSKNLYPESKIDATHFMWKKKKKWFTGLKNCTIVTPSEWLASLVKKSFLRDYSVKVINNGIDLNIFKPVESDFRLKHRLLEKKIILGVAFGWGYRKGLDVFIELSKRLPKEYQIILVGTNPDLDNILPKNILSINRTHNREELADIYSAADVLVNPTREENYPTVNMESIACGTPVITFKTGGSPEIVDEKSGSVVNYNDIDSLEKEIIRICTTNPYTKEKCLSRANSFDMKSRFEEYINLYNDVLKID
ncbi:MULTISPECIES: glycosyltransferase [unclassified Fibrobacter]|uniref:glycosyltransferase n=1 Tax=unclassified Fibrobacter TaxID=2634177 RepID=UPI000D6BA292|nr:MULTISPECIES: glycosyltransferase [unclassified Fibrobacter]PWJ55901.1 glycosyltransferase involved in cell wall biosynthesis [Fibrobacter sp. UWR4]PZW61972.1 glycosyltransferase involved in cell wall biosynthesis [Fibrobacter sp. UWR1]